VFIGGLAKSGYNVGIFPLAIPDGSIQIPNK
jgi:hypothetical protein